ncbi:MAG: FAD:protein FMN transferase [Candidatus Promineifilaceae bacterium]
MAFEPHPERWHRREFRAMGCEMAVWLETADSETATTALDRVEALFATNEQALSRFRPESELSQLNGSTGQWAVVSPLLWDVLSLALKMAAETNGRFDPTMLNALEQNGYNVSFEKLGQANRNNSTNGLAFPGQWAAVELDETLRAVYLPKGVRVDLGGIGKGYTAQQAVDLLRPFGPCLVDAGGDLAAGNRPMGCPGWPVAVSAPWQGEGVDTTDLFTAWLANQALATSGIDYRTWQMNGRPTHHLIDPSTGRPAVTDGVTVTIVAEDAASAEAWATASLVAGSEAGMEALLDADLAGLMVLQDGSVQVTPSMHHYIQNGSFIDNK